MEAGDDEHTTFATSAAMLLRTFDDLNRLADASELTWATQFHGLLTLGGHSLRSIRLDGCVWVTWLVTATAFDSPVDVSVHTRGVQLQGALARPKGNKFVRPDFCIGPNVSLPAYWAKLRAGQAILPLDIGEFKPARSTEDKWYDAMSCMELSLMPLSL
jgi:hypothetical protein